MPIDAYLADYYPHDSIRAAPLRIEIGTVWRWHRDKTVTVWDVFNQKWVRLLASSVPDLILKTLSDSERLKMNNHSKEQS